MLAVALLALTPIPELLTDTFRILLTDTKQAAPENLKILVGATSVRVCGCEGVVGG